MLRIPGKPDLAFAAMVIGPTIMAFGMGLLGYEFHKYANEFHGNVQLIVSPDSILRLKLEEVRGLAKNYEDHLYVVEHHQQEIASSQKEILAAINANKLSDLMSLRNKHKLFSETSERWEDGISTLLRQP